MKILPVILLMVSQISFAQSNLITETISQINFEQDTLKSVFDWVANNIRYDVRKLQQIADGSINKKYPKFKTKKERKRYKLEQVIKRKRGVCEDYSLLFNAILRELGYESYIINGYTKNDKGKINKNVGHAWNAVKVGKEWKLYDTTWAAGYVKDEKRFVRRYNQKWYAVPPKEMLKTHMPYDPMWQLSNAPISYASFNRNSLKEKSGNQFNYDEVIEAHNQKGKQEQIQDQLNRSIEKGEGIRLVKKWRKNLSKNMELYDKIGVHGLLKGASKSSKNAVELFNKYNTAKMKRFKGEEWSINKAEEHLEKAIEEANSASKIYKSIKTEDKKTINFIKKANKSLEILRAKMDKEFVSFQQLKSRFK